MKFRFIILLILLSGSAVAGTVRITDDNWLILQPYSDIPLGPAKDAPEDVLFGFDSGKVTAYYVPTSGVLAILYSRNYRAGRHELKITGRLLSPDTRTKLVGTLVASHLDTDECRGFRQNTDFLFRPELFTSTVESTITIPMDLPADFFICERCGRPVPLCKLLIGVRLVEPPENGSYDNFGFEIAAAEVSGDSDFMIDSKGTLKNAVQSARRLAEELERTHRSELARMKFTNDFDPTAVKPPDEAEKTRRKKLSEIYFLEDELKTFNPKFNIEKLAGWNFTDSNLHSSYMRRPFDPANVEDARICDGLIYIWNASRFIAVWDGENFRWQYVWTPTPNKFIRTLPFPAASGKVTFMGNRQPDRRVSDGEKLTLPQPLRYYHGAYAPAAGSIYFISPESHGLVKLPQDLSSVEPVSFTPPELYGLELDNRVCNIYGCDNQPRLLLMFSGRWFEREVFVLAELDVKTGRCTIKTPPTASPLDFQPDSGLIDPGVGLPLHRVADIQTGYAKDLSGIPALPVTKAMLKRIEHTARPPRLGRYLAVREELPGIAGRKDVVLLDMFSPENSLKLNGFQHVKAVEIDADGKSLLVTMPDGIYRVSPKVMPPAPEIAMPEPVPPLRPMPPERVLKNIESGDPSLFDAAFTAHGLEFTLNEWGDGAEISVEIDSSGLPLEADKFRIYFDRSHEDVYVYEEINDCLNGLRPWKTSRSIEIDRRATRLIFRKSNSAKRDPLIITDILIVNAQSKTTDKGA
ncbi:MAG: hypothetical protein PHI85_11200 [Victivallaceae bacterium]|nr:hypothetical protein [Victivallaceae bacterium]